MKKERLGKKRVFFFFVVMHLSRGTIKKLTQSAGLDSKTGLPECEAGVLDLYDVMNMEVQ
jgi:hypothetical protein